MIGEIVSDMHGMEQVGGMVVDAAGGGAEGEGAGPVQTSAAGRNAEPRRRRRGTGRAASYLHPHPTRRRQGRSAALAVAGDRTGERRTKVGLPSILQDLDYPSFLIQQNQILIYLKQMDIHIQSDPNPTKSKGQNLIGFGFNPIHSQE